MKTGCVYNITVGDKGIYIGSSEDFDKRLIQHNKDVKTKNSKIHKAMRENGGKFVMTKLYDIEYENDVELRIEERKCYDKMKPNLNMNRPYVSDEEMKEYKNKWYNDNIDKIKKRQKKWYQDNADKIKESANNYYIENIDKVRERGKQYRIDNIDKIKERESKKTTCDCGCELSYNALKRHQKTDKHLKLMEAKNDGLITE